MISAATGKDDFDFVLSNWTSSSSSTGQKEEASKRIKQAFESNASRLDLSFLSLNEIPSCIGKLKKLKILELNGNHLSTLPQELAELSELAFLTLDYNRKLSDLPKGLGRILTLQAITTGGTGINHEKVNAIVSRNYSFAVQEKMLASKKTVLKEEFLYSARTPAVQDRIDTVYAALRSGHNWGHKGTIGFYNLLNFSDEDVIAQRIENAAPSKKDLYFIDLGAGSFGWVDAVSGFLRRKYENDKRNFHVIGVTGEGDPFDIKTEAGNITTHKICGFKLENLLESFSRFELHLDQSVELIVTSWTLRHLVDPLGTLEQAYHLLSPGNGFLFGTGFNGCCPYAGQNSFCETLFKAFGMHNYISKRAPHSNIEIFALYKDSDTPFRPRAKGHFIYDEIMPIIEIGDLTDCFAECHANLRPKIYSESCVTHFGGGFHGFGTYVLEKLIGNDPKKIKYQDKCLVVPLFQGIHFLKLYLENTLIYEVSLPDSP